MPGVTIREASVSDIPEILRQRRRMYEDMHYTDSVALESIGVTLVGVSADGHDRSLLPRLAGR